MSGKLQCPGNRACPTDGPGCRYRLRDGRCVLDVACDGEHTHDEVAAADRINEKTSRLNELSAIAKLQALGPEGRAVLERIAKLRALQESPRDFSSEEQAKIVADVRFSVGMPQSALRDPRAAHLSSRDAPVARRAGRTVSRGKDPMKIDGKTTCILADLRARLNVSSDDMTRLTAAAAAGDFSRFDVELRRIETSAAPHTAGSEPDAFELHKDNPHLLAAMKSTGITAANVREHGPRGSIGTRVLPNLRELAKATDARGDRFGKGE